jgi:hypothetical protein
MSRPAVLTDPDWHDHAVQAIVRIAREQGTVTSEDLRKVMDEPENENRYGNAFQAASRRNLIEWISARPSRDKSRRGGLISVWQLHPSQRDKDGDGLDDHRSDHL